MFDYTIDENFDKIFDEKGNSFLALRKIQWNNKGDFRLDMRKWYINSEGEETMGKGVSFLTEDGPHELAKILVENNYGKTNEILHSLSNREDFNIYLDALQKGEDILELDNEDNNEYHNIDDILK